MCQYFQAKWDIKDGFWNIYFKEGEECNFFYFLHQKPGITIMLLVPTSLKWVELNFPLIFIQCLKACSVKNVTKTDIYWNSYCIHSFVILTLLRIFVPRLEILLCINLYFIVFIFK